MKEVFKSNIPSWLQSDVEVDADKAAAQAAEAARKKVLDDAAKNEAKLKAYRDSIKDYDSLNFKSISLRDAIGYCEKRRADLEVESSRVWDLENAYKKELQTTCSHQMVIEKRDTYTDEYDQWHDGSYRRKCVECLLEEESSYHPTDPVYARCYSDEKKCHRLEKSQVVLLRKIINGKEYEVEFNDLTWKDVAKLR